MQVDTQQRRGVRLWLGLAILGSVTLIGGVMLEITSGGEGEEWYIRAWLVLGLAALASHLLFASLPRLRVEKELRELQIRSERQCRSIEDSLEEMRVGDLVRCLEPVHELPEAMREAMDAAARSMAALIQQIQSSSVEVANAAGSVYRTSTDLVAGSAQQEAAVLQITSTTEELARTASQIAINAAHQADFAAQAQEAGDAGVSAVEGAVRGVGELRHGIEAIAGRADTLGSRSREIYRILDLITEIAQETHILALNAAIEASAAGEHGERFAVVAEEVRRLAERSRESVDSVRSLLDDFSEAIRSVVVATEEGSKSANQVLAQSRSTQGAIEKLRSALADTARAASEISLATDAQRTSSDKVVVTVREVGEAIQRITDSFRQVTSDAERLDGLALSIQLLTQSFRIESIHSMKHQVLEWSSRLRDSTSNLEAAEGVLADILNESPYVELAYLVDSAGTMVAFDVNPEVVDDQQLKGMISVGQAFADRLWYQAIIRGQRTTVTQPYVSLLTGARCFTVAAAVRDRADGVVGILGVDVNVRSWTRI